MTTRRSASRGRAAGRLPWAAVAAWLACGACSANMGASETGPRDPGGTGGAATGGAGGSEDRPGACNAQLSLAPARVWRLTDDQVANAVRDLFGVEISREVSAARVEGGTLNLAELGVVTGTTAANYATAARAAAAAIARNTPAVLGCGPGAMNEACVERFIRNKVARAYRRPLDAEEVAELVALYRLGAPDGVAAGVQLVLEAVLQSGSFLWRTEIGRDAAPPPGKKVTLTPFELAAALGFLFFDSVPDDELWAAALDGSLAKRQGLEAQVDRLLAAPRARDTLVKHAGQWLGLGRLARTEKDETLFPAFTTSVRDALVAGEQRFLADVLWSGKLRDLFDSGRVYVDQEVASLYGLPRPSGAGLAVVDLQQPERSAGILSHPAILAAHSSPSRGDVVHRGLFVYNSLFCGSTVPPPPASLASQIAALPKDASERELADRRAQNGSCKGCHALFDAFGLAHERYDAIGVYRDKDANGRPIDQSAVISNLGPPIDGPIDGIRDVAARLAGNRRASDCAVAHLATIALGRQAKEDVTCALQTVKDEFAAKGSFVDLFRALTTSDGFISRDVE